MTRQMNIYFHMLTECKTLSIIFVWHNEYKWINIVQFKLYSDKALVK